MDFLTFLSKLIESLAWPAVLLFIAIVYRESLVNLFESLKSLKVGDLVDASFSREAAQIATVSEAELPEIANIEQKAIENRLLELPPRLAILDAWKLVEDSLEMFMIKKGLGSGSIITGHPAHMPSTSKISELRRSNFITPHQAEILDGLRKLRNEVVHGQYGVEPSQIDAVNYVKSALAFSNFFNADVNFDNK